MKSRITLAFLTSAFCLSAGALVLAQSGTVTSPSTNMQNQTPGRPRRGGFDHSALKLTDAQRAQLKTIRQSVRSQIEALRSDSSLSQEDRRAKIRAINESTRPQILAVLTSEQQQALKHRLTFRRGGGPEGFGPGGPGGRGPRGRGPGPFAALGLSTDQDAKLKSIHQGARSQIDAIRSDSSLTQEQRQAKVRSIMESTRQQTLGILTPEQQQKLNEGHRGGRGRFGPRGRHGGPGGPDGPTTAPPVKP